MAPIEREFDYCPSCELPLSQASTVDPIAMIRTEGAVFRAAAGAPNKIVFVGMWLIFGPGVFAAIAMLYAAGEDWLYAAIPAGLIFLLYGAILRKTTKNYLERRRAGREAGAV